jgi:hypothetical protein
MMLRGFVQIKQYGIFSYTLLKNLSLRIIDLMVAKLINIPASLHTVKRLRLVPLCCNIKGSFTVLDKR